MSHLLPREDNSPWPSGRSGRSLRTRFPAAYAANRRSLPVVHVNPCVVLEDGVRAPTKRAAA
eukprot:4482731-Prymnesium_polylepis.1